MTDEQILKSAIKKAIKGGFPKEEARLLEKVYGIDYLMASIGVQLDRPQYYSVIFSHDFAKAFWGEESTTTRIISRNGADGNASGRISESKYD